jgi:FAD/FMN-containing dehydrogenase
VEAAGREDPAHALGGVLDSVAAVEDVAVATDGHRRSQLWRYREGLTEAINRLGAPHKLDVTLPAPALATFLDQVPDIVSDAAPGATTWLFGHVGDGNVHVNVTGVDPDDLTVDDRVLLFVARLGGSISSEHGIGAAKRPWLHLNRSEAEITAFRLIKGALDPAGILNPNALLPPA